MKMTSQRYARFLQIALILLLVGIVALASCYIFYGKTININRGIAHFSFERPNDFKIKIVDVKDKPGDESTHILLTGPEEEALIIPVISMFIRYASPDMPDSQASWEYTLRMFEGLADFEIMDSTSITVDGIQADEYTFAFKQIPDPYRDPSTAVPVRMVHTGVYFDYGGLIWEITVSSTLSNIELNQAHFDHLLETFKILD